MGAAQRIRGYNDLVGLVYDGVEEAQPWRSLMSRLSEQTSSRDANLVIASPATPGAYVLITDNEDPVATGRTHVDGVMSVNPLLEQPLPQAITLDELMPNGAFLRSPLYLRFLKPLNIRYLLSRDVLRDEMLCAMLTLERNADQQPFSAKEKELVELITPHIRRAMRMREQRAQGSYMQRFFEEAMAKLSIACVLLDGHGRVCSMNNSAQQLLASSEFLGLRGDALRCSGGVDGKPLAKAIELALAAHRNRCRSQRGIGLQLETSPGNGVLDVVVKPLISDRLLESRDKPAAVVYINDCRRPGIELDPAVLVGMYGFTNCESQLAALLARGTNLSDAAGILGVSINTVKTHLRGIYEKMGTNKQAQVVARLNHSTARLL
jgi:DNA-binding CsgD family transcriptional regulator